MDSLQHLLEFILHLDARLDTFVEAHGWLVYILLFGIVFAETGLIIFPFLPGDSLLFACGALAARGTIDVWIVSAVLISAAILGDNVNYIIGRWLGPRLIKTPFFKRWVNQKNLDRTHLFFEKHGGKAVILARFVPIVRTYIPFVAGLGAMRQGPFIAYNVIGALAWITVCIGAGYWFGNIEFVKRNFIFVALGIIIVSILPIGFEIARAKWGARKASGDA